MTTLEVMKTELECVLRNEKGQCNRECEKCDLVLPTDAVVRAYCCVIDMLGE